ncbi:DUF1549 domain-containing protein [Thalassoglobus sp. JC818]|uniref:DUF1549 domain-containing protein n=1 Tax=Thalassoglobus sp. JC818 TaxID=3232136 RepID=UPI00345A377B
MKSSRLLVAVALVFQFILPHCVLAFENSSQPRLSVYPPTVKLTSKRASQSMVIVKTYPDGHTEDVSLSASIAPKQSGIIILRDGFVTPVANGETELLVSHDGLDASVQVEVTNADVSPALTFRNDVLPVLTRSGCNAGKCHGQASGKDGFQLSLYGYDPDGDYQRITREFAGRRINLASPKDCLLVNKAIGMVPHTGGQLFDEESREYRILVEWLQSGAKPDPAETPVPVGIEVFPEQAIFNETNSDQLLTVTAHFSDGSTRDVTDMTVFLSNNERSAVVTDRGLVTSTGPGTAFILARYDAFTSGTSLIVRPELDYQAPEFAANNYIDELVLAHWKNLHLTPSKIASDEVFIRRVYIDLLGLLPTSEELHSFLEDQSPDKRERLVDELLERPEFLDIWVMKWAEVLQVRTANGLSQKGLQIYDQWLRERIQSGATIADVLADVLPASGGTFTTPQANYFQTETSPLLLAENVAQAFLGMRIQCAQCHNHPFDRWTMDDYYGFAAFFSQVGYKNASDPRELTIFNTGEGEMLHPVNSQPVDPMFLGGDVADLTADDDYRQALTSWLTDYDNNAFSRHISNLVWAHFFGLGIIEPYDDVRVSNPPSNPELLQELGKRMAAYEFDIKPLVRDICISRVYQLSSSETDENSWDDRHFSHSRIRRIRAEVLLDCINQVNGTTEEFPNLPPGSRAVHVADGQSFNYFLTTFGRADRDTPCSCEVSTSPTLSQALHLLNGEVTTGKIEEGQIVSELIQEHNDAMAVVAELYERCLSRRPTESERTAIAVKLSTSQDIAGDLEDLLWALFNSNEFIFNH